MAKIHGKLGRLRIGDSLPVRVMGVINLSKNSFYSGSVKIGDEEILETAVKMKEQGADVLDIGARSTAPYRKYDIPSHAEAKVLSNAIRLVSSKVDLPVSADTTRFEPAAAAVAEGATIINDVYGLSQKDSPEIARLVSRKEVSLVLAAHSKKSGKLRVSPIEKVRECLEPSLKRARENSVDEKRLVIDPAIGFFTCSNISNIDWNCAVLSDLEELRSLKLPICVGISRKRFIGQLTGDAPAGARLSGSLAAAAIAVYKGAHVIRAHDVKETVEAVRVAEAIREKKFKL